MADTKPNIVKITVEVDLNVTPVAFRDARSAVATVKALLDNAISNHKPKVYYAEN